jgi:hypothetical protein
MIPTDQPIEEIPQPSSIISSLLGVAGLVATARRRLRDRNKW